MGIIILNIAIHQHRDLYHLIMPFIISFIFLNFYFYFLFNFDCLYVIVYGHPPLPHQKFFRFKFLTRGGEHANTVTAFMTVINDIVILIDSGTLCVCVCVRMYCKIVFRFGGVNIIVYQSYIVE